MIRVGVVQDGCCNACPANRKPAVEVELSGLIFSLCAECLAKLRVKTAPGRINQVPNVKNKWRGAVKDRREREASPLPF